MSIKREIAKLIISTTHWNPTLGQRTPISRGTIVKLGLVKFKF